MKLIQVNQTKKALSSKEIKSLDKVFKQIVNYFKSKKIRNQNWLSEKSELTVVFLTAVEMQRINRQFRKKNKPTDVLSFVSDDPQSLGELLFCSDVLKKQATQQKHSLFAETTYMLVHGLLHLLEYDHEISKKEEKLMFKLQDECFDKLELR
jgi:probable rRNA maturation factor